MPRSSCLRTDGRAEEAPKPSSGGAVTVQRVEPGAAFTLPLLLNFWFDFNIPGRYVLDIESVKLSGEDDLPDPVRGHLEFEVGPRDAERLYRLCSEI